MHAIAGRQALQGEGGGGGQKKIFFGDQFTGFFDCVCSSYQLCTPMARRTGP